MSKHQPTTYSSDRWRTTNDAEQQDDADSDQDDDITDDDINGFINAFQNAPFFQKLDELLRKLHDKVENLHMEFHDLLSKLKHELSEVKTVDVSM